jgi:5-methylcytosine-specific restriction protein A
MPWSSSNRRAHLPPNWAGIRLAVLARDGGQCTVVDNGQRCAQPANEVHHAVNRDDHRMEALVSICSWHHKKITAKEAAAARHRWYNNKRTPEPHP